MYYGAYADIKDSKSFTPLYHACNAGYVEIVRWLLIWGSFNSIDSTLCVNLEVVDSQQRTSLHQACQNGFPPVVALLIDHGANIMAVTSAGNTPLHTVCTKPISSVVYKECADILLTYGASKTEVNNSGQTPSQIALMSGNIEISDYIKKWNSAVQNRISIDTIIESEKFQWQNIQKMMSIGKHVAAPVYSSQGSFKTVGTALGRSTMSIPSTLPSADNSLASPSIKSYKRLSRTSVQSIFTSGTSTTTKESGGVEYQSNFKKSESYVSNIDIHLSSRAGALDSEGVASPIERLQSNNVLGKGLRKIPPPPPSNLPPPLLMHTLSKGSSIDSAKLTPKSSVTDKDILDKMSHLKLLDEERKKMEEELRILKEQKEMTMKKE